MRTEAEIKAALVRAIAGSINGIDANDLIAIRTLGWVLDIDVTCVKPPLLKRHKQAVAADHFAA